MTDVFASGVLQCVFVLKGRGTVLFLEGVLGTIHGSQVVKGPRGTSGFLGPQLVPRADHAPYLAVMATAPDAEELFRVGDQVTFTTA